MVNLGLASPSVVFAETDFDEDEAADAVDLHKNFALSLAAGWRNKHFDV